MLYEVITYYRYVTDVLNHQLLSNVDEEVCKKYIGGLKKNNKMTVPLGEIDFSPLHKQIFTLPENINDYSSYFLEVLSAFYRHLKGSRNNFV